MQLTARAAIARVRPLLVRGLAASVAVAAFTPTWSSARAQSPAASLSTHPRIREASALLDRWLDAQRAYQQIPSLAGAVVHDQTVIWQGASGWADRDRRIAATPATLYSICSISKLFTSIAVMQERDAGRLRLDDPVSRHLPWFGLKRQEGEGEVVIEGLLTHASGLPRESDHAYWTGDFAFPTRDEIVARIKSQEPLYAPERRFQYSNLGITLAGEIVSATSGLGYDDYARTRILEPLGLRSTTTDMPAEERGKRLAAGYAALDREGQRRRLPLFSVRGIAPAAGYASTATDLARFASWQFRLLEKGGSELLRATTLREMYRIHWAEPDLETLWGLGFVVWRSDGKMFVGHDGSCPGYRTALLLMPQEKIATVLMANANGVSADRWAQHLYDLVSPGLLEAVKDPGKGKAADPALQAYAGAYSQQPWGGEVAFLPWEDGLMMADFPSQSPAKDLAKFKRVGPQAFRRVHKDDTPGETIVFELGPDGRATLFKQHQNNWLRMR
jgi:CubicO group peptidase (beta-lactamase class C family)